MNKEICALKLVDEIILYLRIFSPQFLCQFVLFTSFPLLCRFASVPHCCKPLLQLRMYCFSTIHTTGITTYIVGK